jgi:membrane fusion protein, multidrug efflux system
VALEALSLLVQRVILILIAGIGFLVVPSEPISAQQPSVDDGTGTAIPVTVVSVVRQDIPILLRNIGTVQAFQAVVVRSRVDGTLDQVFFTEGHDVKSGERLALIDPRPYAAALAQVQARRNYDQVQLENARRDLARYQSLVRNDFASRQQVDTQVALVEQIAATLQGDEATIAAAQLNLNFCTIVAPIDGRVGLRQADVGNFVRASDTSSPGIVSITQIHPIAVLSTLPQDALPRIQTAMGGGRLSVFAYTPDNRTLLGTGELLTIDNTIDQGTGTIKMKVVFPNQDNHLWPGQFVNVRIQISVMANAITVPSISVQRSQSTLFVFVVKSDSTVAIQPVEVGQDDGATAVILNGLSDGVEVVVSGMSRLQNGSRVVANRLKTNG